MLVNVQKGSTSHENSKNIKEQKNLSASHGCELVIVRDAAHGHALKNLAFPIFARLK